MTQRAGWLIVGIVLIIVLSEYAPRIAGIFVLLLVTYLGLHSLSHLQAGS